MTKQATHQDILLWAEEKGIFEHATKKDQFCKMAEELGEVAECISKDLPVAFLEAELGDLYVTLILLAHLANTSAEKCLTAAYNKISKRTGRMQDGVFIKDEDVEERLNNGG